LKKRIFFYVFQYQLNQIKLFLEKSNGGEMAIDKITQMMSSEKLTVYVEEFLGPIQSQSQFHQDLNSVLLCLTERKEILASAFRLLFFPKIFDNPQQIRENFEKNCHFVILKFLCIDFDIVCDELKNIDCVEGRKFDRTTSAFCGERLIWFEQEVKENTKKIEKQREAFYSGPLWSYLPLLHSFKMNDGASLLTRIINRVIDGFSWTVFGLLCIHLKYNNIENIGVVFPFMGAAVLPLVSFVYESIFGPLSQRSGNDEEKYAIDEFAHYCERKSKESDSILQLSGSNDLKNMIEINIIENATMSDLGIVYVRPLQQLLDLLDKLATNLSMYNRNDRAGKENYVGNNEEAFVECIKIYEDLRNFKDDFVKYPLCHDRIEEEAFMKELKENELYKTMEIFFG
jgi:hypothetical protein